MSTFALSRKPRTAISDVGAPYGAPDDVAVRAEQADIPSSAVTRPTARAVRRSVESFTVFSLTFGLATFLLLLILRLKRTDRRLDSVERALRVRSEDATD